MRDELFNLLKSIIKKSIVSLFGRDFSMMSIEKNAEWVSFDIYDTAILRSVRKPEDVYDLVQEEYTKKYGWNHSGSFRRMRGIAEKKARLDSKNGEVSLCDIYNRIGELSNTERSKLEEIEVEIESEISFCNPDFKKLYDQLLLWGVNIIFISDMYLSQDVINRMLLKNGVIGFSKIYVSCEYGVNKKKGELFDFVLNDLGIQRHSLVHIGDNAWGDYTIPKSKGIRSYLYRRRL